MFTTLMISATALAIAAITVQSQGDRATPPSANPLTRPWAGPYGGVPPWDLAKPELFPGAFEAAIAEQRAEIAAIAADPNPPTFDNTIAAMERSGQMLDRLNRLFGVVRQNISTPQIQALDREWQPKLAAAEDAIVFNPGLFKRIEAVYGSLATSTLTRRAEAAGGADLRHLRAPWRQAERRRKEAAVRHQPAACDAVLGVPLEGARGREHVDRARSRGRPRRTARFARLRSEGCRRRARAPGQMGHRQHAIQRRSVPDVLDAAGSAGEGLEEIQEPRRQRRPERHKATIASIVKLRAERAKLLDFASHAHWRMSDTMALEPKAAQALMMRVWPAAVARVKEEVADMQAIAAREGAAITIEPWDYLFYAEKVRKARYDLDQAQLKPYFELNNMVAAALWSAEQRYDIRFTEITGKVPVFHPDVRVFEVTDVPSGAHRGLFYLDNFARAGKRSGAWAASYRTQHKLDKGATAISSNNNNFVKAAAGEPVLISLDDATTLFHEFGHALHSLLQDITYPGLSTTPRDFVEYPSQVNEHWLLTREVLDKYARHYQTGQPMPQALVDRIKESEKFNQGYATVEYLAAAILDMELHTRSDGAVDVDRLRARPACTDRHAARDRPAPPAAALRSPVRQRCVLRGVLQLPVVGRHGRRHLAGVRRGGSLGQGARGAHADAHPVERKHERSGRGLPPVPRARSGRQGAARQARISRRAVAKILDAGSSVPP